MEDGIPMSTVRSYLRQLKQTELLQLAKSKHAKIPKRASKPDLVKILAPFVSQKEVLQMFRKPGETGLKGQLSGSNFERKALSVFKRMGYSCQLNVHIKGSEFDVVGDKGGGWFSSKEWILAECKNKPKVFLNDFMKFVGKLETFKRKHSNDEVHGYFVASGVFDPNVKAAKREHPGIQLKRIKA